MLLSSELLLWYINNGLKVTKLHQATEYHPARCFRSFVKKVKEDDFDPNLKPREDASKTTGNVAFGSTLLNKELHNHVVYTNTTGRAQTMINSPRFKKMDGIGDDLYEIRMTKPQIDMDIPVQIGFNILQLAKLSHLVILLRFYDEILR